MAKVSSIEKNNKRVSLSIRYKEKRDELKNIIMDKNSTIEERFLTMLKLAKIKRNSAQVRVRNRCKLTGKPRGFYRKFKLSRIALRDLGSQGVLPGIRKASW